MSEDRGTPGRLRLIVAGPEPIVHELEPIVHELDPTGPAFGPDTSRPADGGADLAAALDSAPAEGRVALRRLIEPRGRPARYEVVVDGWRFEIEVESVARAILRERASGAGGRGSGPGRQVVAAQIPGRIVGVGIRLGEAVSAGQRLLSIEAMKMENAVIAPWAGTIAHIGVVPGQTVERGDELVVIE